MPVSARTSVLLPQSTCPAVATTCTAQPALPASAPSRVASAWRTASSIRSSSPSGTQRRSSRQEPSWTRGSTAGSPVRKGPASASGSRSAHPGRATPGAPPPPTRPSCATTGTPRAAASRSVRFRKPPRVRVQRLDNRRWFARDRRLQRGEGKFVGPDGTGKRVARQPGDDLRAAKQQTGLGTAQQFVAAGDDDVGPAGQRGGGIRFLGKVRIGRQQSTAKVGHECNPVRRGQRAQFVQWNSGGESVDPEVARVDLEYAAGDRSEGAGVVPQVGPVGGAHLAQRCARRFDQVRQPEAGTDLNQFPAAHHHLPAGGEGCGGQHQRRSPVVDHQCVLGGGTRGEQCSPGPGAAAGAAAGLPDRAPRRRSRWLRQVLQPQPQKAVRGRGWCG